MIVRTWGGRVPLEHAEGFHTHLLATGVADYRRQSGCADVQVWRRDESGTAHFLLVSWWHDIESVRRYAGDDVGAAVRYPGDDRYELVPDTIACHFDQLFAVGPHARKTEHPRIVSASELRRVVRLADLVDPMASAFVASSTGQADSGLVVMTPAQRRSDGDVYVKTATLHGHAIYVVKIAPWFAVNAAQGRRQGGFLAVFDSTTGHTLALLDDEHFLSDLRTAAAGSVVADVLAPVTVDTALVLGSGVQAFWQPLALHHVRAFRTLLVWARNASKATTLAARLRAELPKSVAVMVVDDLQPAVRRADVVLTATSARDPLVLGSWLRPGQHITAVGADDETKCELDADALRRARVFVDARKTAAATGDVHRAVQTDRYDLTDIAGEIGDVLTGAAPGRTSDQDITIATLAGLGVQDLLTAEAALRALGLPVPQQHAPSARRR